jgi:hypothetical protein
MYNRYAESGRIEWVQQYIRHIDPDHAKEWSEVMTPNGNGLILRKITTEYKFVSSVGCVVGSALEAEIERHAHHVHCSP